MKKVMYYRNALFIIFFYGVTFFYAVNLHGQTKSEGPSNEDNTHHASRLFDNDDILHFKLTGKLNDLFKDISNNNSYHPVLLQYLEKIAALFQLS